MNALEVVRPGWLTTVQDLGRVGFQKYGVPASGAMDQTALRAANLLVDNPQGAAGLEATGEGPSLRALVDLVVAVVGADMEALLDGRPVKPGCVTQVRSGQLLELGRARRGLRAYLAIAGGIDVPLLLGSRSTCLPAAFGGFRGRPLRDGDHLQVGPLPKETRRLKGRSLPPDWWRPPGESPTFRVILGPQDDRFTPEGIRTFLTAEYRLSPEMDRMGARLRGPSIGHRSGADIVSDSIPLGAVQVPADGQPIILMADRQTTGGYTKIAVVLREDTYRLAQAGPGTSVHFRQVSVKEAQASLRSYEATFQALVQGWERGREQRNYTLQCGGRTYRVGVEGGEGAYRVSLGKGMDGRARKGEGR